DYMRFPEGFKKRDDELEYSKGDYADAKDGNIKRRVQAVTDFVAYAREELAPYGVDVAVDIFGYAATIEETPGIGQNFAKISANVEVISSMIYPSHWTAHYFDIPLPDKEPYRLVTEYAKVDNEVLGELDDPRGSRPRMHDFEAAWVHDGTEKQYGTTEGEAQIKTLTEAGIEELLISHPSNSYTENVDETPLD